MSFLTDVERIWDADILPALHDYIAIPNVSPAFDPEWAEHRHMADAVELSARWCEARPIEGMTRSTCTSSRGAPRSCCATSRRTATPPRRTRVLLYGHLDKQPPMTGWHDGLGPWTPGAARREALRPRRRRRRLRRPSRPSPPSRPLGPRAPPTPDASSSSRRARNRAAPTCRRTSTRSATASATRRSSSASTRVARPTTGSGRPPRCAGLVGVNVTVRGPRRGRALRCVRRSGAVLVPHPPLPARPHRGRVDRRAAPARAPCRASPPTGSPRSTRPPPRSPTAGGPFPIVDGLVGPRRRRPGDAAAQPDLATGPRLRRRRRPTGDASTPATCCARSRR